MGLGLSPKISEHMCVDYQIYYLSMDGMESGLVIATNDLEGNN